MKLFTALASSAVLALAAAPQAVSATVFVDVAGTLTTQNGPSNSQTAYLGLPLGFSVQFSLDSGVTRHATAATRTRYHGNISSIVIGGHSLDVSQFQLHASAITNLCPSCNGTSYTFALSQRNSGLLGPLNENMTLFAFTGRAGAFTTLPDDANPLPSPTGVAAQLALWGPPIAEYYGGPATITFQGTSPAPINGGLTVPEPATWAMMLIGFGALGSTMRRARVRRLAA